jgi:signal peptidase
MHVPNQELMQIVRRDALAHGACARLTVSGGSMWPFIPSGAAVVIEPYRGTNVRVGDIALAQRPDGDCLLHRVARIRAGGIYLLGDAQEALEGPFTPHQLLGRVTTVERRGRAINTQGPLCRLTGSLWLLLRPWRRSLLWLGAWAWRHLRRVCRRQQPPD